MIPEPVLREIQDRTDIVELVSAVVPLKRAGRNFKACCPFHNERTPSFVVSPDKQIFHCFGCGAGGNVFSFVMRQHRKDFREAVEMLAERARVEIPSDRAADPRQVERLALFRKANELAADFYHDVLLNKKEGAPALEYLRKRGIERETIEAYRLGWAPASWDAFVSAARDKVAETVLEKLGLVVPRKEGGYYDRFRARVIFPIQDPKGAVIAFGGRVMDESLPKYLNSPESEVYSKGRNLYGLAQARTAIRDRDCAVVVEGYMDLLACHQAGVTHAVASLGTALTPEQARLLKRHSVNAVMLYDADAAGESATARGLEILLEEGMNVGVVRLAPGHDPDSFVRANGAEAFKAALAQASSLFDYKLGLLKKKFDATNVEGKVRIANEMVLLLAKVPNEILKAAWLKELSRELSLSEEALKSELERPTAQARRALSAEPAAPAVPEGPTSAAERLMLGLCLEDRRYLKRARTEMALEDFAGTQSREVARYLWESGCGASELVNRFREDTEAVRFISMSAAEAETIDDREKAFEDCLVYFKRSRLSQDRDVLQRQIVQAQEAGDRNRLGQLLNDFNRLNRGIKRIHEEKK